MLNHLRTLFCISPCAIHVIYAYSTFGFVGVYADDSDIKKLNGKYGTTSLSDLKDKREFIADALESDIRMTVRLQIVYGRLGIRSVRNAFAKSIGTRLQKFSASDPSDTDQLLKKYAIYPRRIKLL